MKNKIQNIFIKNKIMCIILFLVFSTFLSVTIAYSAIFTTAQIAGTAYARVEANARVTDFRLSTTNNATSSFEEFGKEHIVTEIDLKDTTSSITYYLEITNYGTTDVGIFDITGLPTNVNYSIKDYNLKDKICDDTGNCNSFIKKTYEITFTTTSTYAGNIQLNFDFRPFYTITYENIDNSSSYPQDIIEGGELSITFNKTLYRLYTYMDNDELSYQIEGNSIYISEVTNDVKISQKGSIARIKSGSLGIIGSEVLIGDESFYVIKNDGTTLTLLTKYNLYVGGYNDSNAWYAYGDEATGRQDPTMLGWISGDANRNGTTVFSNNTYKGTNYSDYEGSLIQTYVDNYSNYLSSLGELTTTGRLITITELDELGCNSTNKTCSAAYSWVKTSSYWTSTPETTTAIWYVMSGGSLGNGEYNLYSRGVRPVIELPVEQVDDVRERNAILVSGDLNTQGSIVQIANEQFNIISNDGKNLLLFASNNLYIGSSYNTADGTTTAYTDATGLQDSTMKGVYDSSSTYEGVIGFSSTNYWSSSVSEYPTYVYDSNSLLYEPIEFYRNYINEQGVYVKEARPISKEELNSIGCNYDKLTCTTAEKWVYATSFWTGTAQSSTYVHANNSRGNFDQDQYSRHTINGVRPLIKISVDEVIIPS